MGSLKLVGIFFFLSCALFAQVELNVEGDAKISGELELGENRNNVILGYLAGLNTTGNWNTFIGTRSGGSTTSGSQNTFYGNNSGRSNITGGTNTFIGYFAGYNSEAFGNTFVGNDAGLANTGGIWNTYLGHLAGRSSTGSYNTFIGKSAGYTNNSGSKNTFIGYEAGNLNLDNPFDNAIAIGYESKVECSNCAVIGGTGSNAVFVGIGTTTPFRPLDIHGEAIFREENRVVTFQSSGNNAFFAFENNGSTAGANVGYFNDNAEAYYYIDAPGGVFGEMIVEDNGDIFQNGSLIHSDRRFKTAIRPLEQALEKIIKLNGVSYMFQKQALEKREFDEGRNLGVIAQEVELVLPELVRERPDGYKAVNYDGFIPLLIEGMKEQQIIINGLQERASRLNQLEDIILQQQAQIAELKMLLEQMVTNKQTPIQNEVELRRSMHHFQDYTHPFRPNTPRILDSNSDTASPDSGVSRER